MKKETRVIHQPTIVLPQGNEPLVGPIHRSVKYTFPSLEAARTPEARLHGFDYSRDANPTTRQLEQLCAELQGREDAVCVSTGMAAVWLTVLGNLTAGDRIVFFLECYRPIRTMIRERLVQLGIEYAMLSVHDHDAMAEVFADERTKLLLFEAPTNPMLQVPDLETIVGLAKANGVSTVLDNTFAGLHNHGQFEIDFYLHSLTKYSSGHGDVMGGIVIADRKRIASLKPWAINMGATLDPGAAYLILRGLRTYFLRYRRHSDSALQIARYLAANPRVDRVFYPALESDPGYRLAGRQMDGCGAVLSFNLAGDRQQAWRFIDALQLFATTSSIGSTESLVAPVRLYFARDLSDDEVERAGITDGTVRLSVGLEHPDDLIADLEQALDKAFS
ncbi:MAG TPA: PLP-dependent aspartate aminotransferase family protein [Gammaproteobacteria bacterium]|jgi:cystathionine beta-lyase/cystathionine gamma-synthase